MSPRDERALLNDVVDRINRVSHAEGMLVASEAIKDWEVAKTAFDAILYDLIVIGEIVKSLSESIKRAHPLIPWREITGMRDILTHEYFRVNSSIVRATIDSPLAELNKVCLSLLRATN